MKSQMVKCVRCQILFYYPSTFQSRLTGHALTFKKGIYEELCDNTGPFHLCKKGFMKSRKYNTSCVFEKPHTSGMIST